MFVVIVAAATYAVDMKGKFGMGIGTTRFGDLLKPSLFAMRYGLSDKIVIEPWLDITDANITLTIPPETTYWDTTPEIKIGAAIKNKGIGVRGYFTLRNMPKSNLYGIAGFTFGMLEPQIFTKVEQQSYKATASVPVTYFSIPLGVGGEYFLVSDHLSININATFGYGKISGKTKTKSESSGTTVEDYGPKLDLSLLNIGNTLCNIYFMLYF